MWPDNTMSPTKREVENTNSKFDNEGEVAVDDSNLDRVTKACEYKKSCMTRQINKQVEPYYKKSHMSKFECTIQWGKQ